MCGITPRAIIIEVIIDQDRYIGKQHGEKPLPGILYVCRREHLNSARF